MKRIIAAAAVAVAASCSPVTSCIARGARVRTPRGNKRIEEFAIGDEIYSVNPATGSLHATTVTAIKSSQRECVRLDVDGETLICTSDHPLYCPDSRSWAAAGDWALGERKALLRVGAETVSRAPVTNSSTFAGVYEVFDLTVEDALHNFVANDLLVHNKEPAQRQCGPDGGFFEFNVCGCGDGGEGSIRCERDGGATCEFCANTDGGVDGGP